MATKSELQDLIGLFPEMEFAMAYGSVAFEQKHHNSSNSMLDLVFAVKDPTKWHAENLQRFPHHYSALKYLGAENISSIQQNYGAGLYYNTLISVPQFGRQIKYGVISTQQLCHDLLHWRYLYTSGRMHKPVTVIQADSQDISQAIESNYRSALAAALLLLPPRFTAEELFVKIAGLSYAGDFRMRFGESPRKVRNIVEGNFDEFQRLYDPYIKESPCLMKTSSTGLYESSNSSELWSQLPVSVAKKNPRALSQQLARIVARSSRSQSIKGILTAGMVKSGVYVYRKLSKAIR